MDKACESTRMDADEPARQTDVASEQPTKVAVEALLADLDHARELSSAAERRGRTYLARRGVLDQTKRDLSSLLREALADP